MVTNADNGENSEPLWRFQTHCGFALVLNALAVEIPEHERAPRIDGDSYSIRQPVGVLANWNAPTQRRRQTRERRKPQAAGAATRSGIGLCFKVDS